MLKTMQEIRATTEIYPSEINIHQAEKDVINSWFDLRYVCDNDKFVTFFQRVLIRDYGRYRELLRIEPNISKYDWLVQQYMESQTYNKGSDVTANNGIATDTTQQETTSNNTATRNTTDNLTGTHRNQVSGTDSTNKADTHITTHSGEDITTDATNSNMTTHTTQQAGGSDNSVTYNHNNNKGLSKTQPMSVTYPNGMSIDDIGNIDDPNARGNRGVLNWSYPSEQNEQDTRNKEDSTTNYGRVDNNNTTQSNTGTGTNTLAHGHRITESVTGNDLTSHNVDGTDTDNETRTGTGTDTNSGTSSTEGTTTHDTSSETVANRTNLTQHINTGRSIDTATLLSQARAFIINSSAMAWLIDRLEFCFMGVYNDSNEDYL